MKNYFLKIWKCHEFIGKVLSIVIVFFVVVALIGLIDGRTKFLVPNDVVETNYFLNENVPVHDSNYNLVINDVCSLNTLTILDKNEEEIHKDGFFISLNVTMSQKENSTLSKHTFDKNDFKLKDHTGVYIPLSDIAGAIGWNLIDVHFDEADGGNVMSSTEFSTKKCVEDYNFIDQSIEHGEEKEFVIIFDMESNIRVEDNLIVLEVDLYNLSNGYRQGNDIVLLPRPIIS